MEDKKTLGFLPHSLPLIIATIVLVIAVIITFNSRIAAIGERHHYTSNEIGSLPPLSEDDGTGVAVLCHHYLRGATTPLQFGRILGALILQLPIIRDMGLWTQTASGFEMQMQYLKVNGYESITLDELFEWQHGLRSLPEKSVVITFDDGDRSVLEVAKPILEEYDYRATLFIVTGKVGQKWSGVENLSWEELRELQATGRFSIQSHSHDLHWKVSTAGGPQPVFVAASEGHHTMSGGPWTEQVLEDLKESRRLIEQELGQPANFLAWPYGFADDSLDSLALLAGFRGMCTLRAGKNKPQPSDHLARQWIARGNTAVVASSDAEWSSWIRETAARRPGVDWEQFEMRRYTITARTSLQTFRRMVGR